MPAHQETFRFDDDGETPNNPRLPLVVYRLPIALQGITDAAAEFEKTFARHGWGDGWRDGIFDFLHFHTHTHEVLGIAAGSAAVEFGGAKGRTLELTTGDVVILPAGTGHRRVSCSRDLLVIGAYPGNSGRYDEQTPMRVSHGTAVEAVARVPLPEQDPVFGKDGPLMMLWK